MKIEAKVIVTVIAGLLLAEIFARVAQPRLSLDVRNLSHYQEIPSRIVAGRASGQTSILIVGNSLARAGINADVVEEVLEKQGVANPRLYFITPDGSNINEWTASYRKYFRQSRSQPDFVLLVSGAKHLNDQQVGSPEKLAAFHVGKSDHLLVLRNWLSGGNERGRYFFAVFSRLFANRERVNAFFFYRVIPGYEKAAREMNHNRLGNESAIQKSFSEPEATRFSSLLDFLDEREVPSFLLAVPLPKPYKLPEAVRSLSESRGVHALDWFSEEEWPIEAFPDGYHLEGEYSEMFSKRVGKAIGQLIREAVEEKT